MLPARAILHRLTLRARYVLWQRRRLRHPALVRVADLDLVVLPGVLHPVIFMSGALMANALSPTLIPPGSRVLELGTGSGVVALSAALLGADVVGVDLNPDAVRCTRINGLLNRLEAQIDVRHGDLFAPVVGEQFDRILFNPPYLRGAPSPGLGMALRAGDVVNRFAADLPDYLRPTGYALLLWSSRGDAGIFNRAFAPERYRSIPVATHDTPSERFTLYRLEPAR